MFDEGRVFLREGSRYWWVLLLTGIAWLVVAWLVLRANITSLTTVGILIGVLFIAAGVNEAVIGTAVSGGWKFLHWTMAGILLLGGLWAFIRPVNTFFALASVLGLILILWGTFDIIRAVASREENRYWWIGLVTGILMVLLAFWVSSSDRVYNLANRTFLILFWVGFMALVHGISQIMLAFSVRRLGRDLEARAPVPEPTAPTTPTAPV